MTEPLDPPDDLLVRRSADAEPPAPPPTDAEPPPEPPDDTLVRHFADAEPPPEPPDDTLVRHFADAEPSPRRTTDAEHVRRNLRAALFGEPEAITALGGYRIVRTIGRGGMGVVLEGEDAAGQRIALKTLQRPDPAAIQRFKQEFRSVADLGHRNLAAVEELAYDEASGEWYLAMEYVPGVRWLEHLRPGGALASEAALRDALGQLAAGVHALHGAGLLHRDLKPSNVLVTPAGRVKIVDFGLAELVAAGPEGAVVGTAGFLAPELRRGEPASPASDWYAVGVMLALALTGRLPPHPLPDGPLADGAPADLEALCRDLLAGRPDDRPRGEAVLRRLGRAPAPAALPTAFVGRARELAACAAALAAAPALVLLAGASGTGKSALLAHLLADLRAADALVLAGRCFEGESVPHKALDGVVDALARHLVTCPDEHVLSLLPEEAGPLVRLFPALARVRPLALAAARPGRSPLRSDDAPATDAPDVARPDSALGSLAASAAEAPGRAPPRPGAPAPADAAAARPGADPREARRRALAGLRRLLAGLARARPLVLAVDDLQWGDADSARLLADLLAPPDAPPVRVVATVRSDVRPGSPFFRELGDVALGCPVHDIPVEPLAPADALALARALLRADDDPDAATLAAAIARASQGNPLLLEAMVRGRSVGAAPDDALLAQLAELDAPARAALERLAVAGRPLPRVLTHPARRADLQLLRAAHLVRAGGDRDTVETYHDLVRTVVLRHLDADARKDHHRALAEALAAAPSPDPDELVLHFHGAGDLPRAGAWALQAADRAAAALAFTRAAELYARALSWKTWPPEQGLKATLARADALVHAGRCAEAAPVYLGAAAQAPDRVQELALRRRAVEQYLVSGRVEEGLALLQPLVRELELPFPATAAGTIARLVGEQLAVGAVRRLSRRARAPVALSPRERLRIDVCWSAGKGLGFIDPIRGAVFSTHGLRLTLTAGDPRLVARASALIALMDVNDTDPGRVAFGRRTIDDARVTADHLADPYLVGLTTILGGVAAMNRGEWRGALERVDAGTDVLRRHGVVDVVWERGIAESMAMHALLMLGEFPALRARADRWQREAEDTGDRFGAVVAILYTAHATLAAGDPAGARAAVRKALSLWTYDRFSFQHWLALGVEVACDLYEGRGAAAAERVEAAWPGLQRAQLLRMQIPRIDAHLLRGGAALATGSPWQRRRAAREAAALAREPIELAAAAHDLITAQLAAVRGEPGAAPRLFAAADRFARGEMSALAAAVRLAAARLGGADTREHARALARCGVREPARWAATVAPALYDLSS